MVSLLRPMVQRELVEYQSNPHVKGGSANGSKPKVNLSSHGASNNNSKQESIPEKFPLTTWLLDRYRSTDSSLDHLLQLDINHQCRRGPLPQSAKAPSAVDGT